MTPAFIESATSAIRSAVCTHMPSAAIASGMLSPVDQAAAVSALATDWEALNKPARVSEVEEWLNARGIVGGRQLARAVRMEVIIRDMRRGNPVK